MFRSFPGFIWGLPAVTFRKHLMGFEGKLLKKLLLAERQPKTKRPGSEEK